MGDSAPVVFVFRQQERVRGDARSCQPCLITRYANRGGIVTMNLGDNNDPDLALLSDGTYAIEVQAGGAGWGTSFGGVIPGTAFVSNLPGGHVAQVINVSVTGKMATNGTAHHRAGGSALQPSPEAENTGGMFAPMLFNNYNGWVSSVAVTASTTGGGLSAAFDITFYDEGGGFVGSYTDSIASGSPLRVVYLPALPFLPEGFRGTAVVRTVLNQTGGFPGFSMAGQVMHVNYDRNHAMSYDLIGSSAVTFRGDSLGEIPCISLGFTTCAWGADVNKTGAVTAEGGLGVNTGIRIFNPDPPMLGTGVPLGIPARVIALYIDNSGVIWSEATQEFQIPPYGVHTLFPAYNRRLPDVFRGTIRLMSTGNAIVAIANTVDYSVTGRDASGAYNLQYHTGRTQ
jgi:hypothetical protein